MTDPWPLEPAGHFLLRVAGLPADVLTPLRAPRTAAWADEALAHETALAARAQRVEDALARAVGRAEDAAVRRRLLALRRDVHNGRPPADPGAARDLAGALEPEERPHLLDWLALAARHEEGLASSGPLLAAELGLARAHLRTLAEDPRLRAGLQAASPSLDTALPAYVAAPGQQPLGKRLRSTERSLLSYVLRAALKTSPFSTLTTVAHGRFDTASGALLTLTDEPSRLARTAHTPAAGAVRHAFAVTSRARPNLTAVHEITRAALHDPGARTALPLRPVSGARRADGRLHYVRRRFRPSDNDTLAAPGVLEEEVFHLAAGPVLDEVLALLPDGSPGLTQAELAASLHSSDPGGRPLEALHTYLARLVGLGVLTAPALTLDVHHPEPVADLVARLRALDTPWAGRVADALDLLHRTATALPLAPREERARLARAVRTETADAQRALGRTEPVVPRTAVYEDVVPASAVATADRGHWEKGPLPALRRTARLLPAFDLLLADRLLARGHFRSRHGPGGVCDDVPGFARDLHGACARWLSGAATSLGRTAPDGTYVPRANPYRLPEVDALAAAHREFGRAVDEALRGAPEGAQEVALGAGALDRVGESVAGALPGTGTGTGTGAVPGAYGGPATPVSHSFYLQLAAPRDGRPYAVLNWAYSGLGQPAARFAGAFDGGTDALLVAGLRQRLARLAPPGAVFADLSGGYDTSNLALRPAVAPYRIVGPAEAPHGPEDARIPVDDLFLVDDEESGELQLRSRRLAARVIPVHLGGLVPMALPQVQRTLLTLSPAAMPVLDVWAGAAGAAALRRLPRVRHEDLVLSRRTWHFRAMDLPADRAGRRPPADTADGFLAWRRWWRHAGLPPRVLVRTRPTAKPQPVDVDSPYALALLAHGTRDARSTPVFTEMLPDLTELPLTAAGSGHVSELCVELDSEPAAPGRER